MRKKWNIRPGVAAVLALVAGLLLTALCEWAFRRGVAGLVLSGLLALGVWWVVVVCTRYEAALVSAERDCAQLRTHLTQQQAALQALERDRQAVQADLAYVSTTLRTTEAERMRLTDALADSEDLLRDTEDRLRDTEDLLRDTEDALRFSEDTLHDTEEERNALRETLAQRARALAARRQRQHRLLESMRDTLLKLRRARRAYDTLMVAIDRYSPVLVMDAEGKITHANDLFVRIGGYVGDEIFGRSHRLLRSSSQPQAIWDAMWQHVSSGRTWLGQVCIRAKGGSEYWNNTLVFPFFDDHGAIEKYFFLHTDITELVGAKVLARDRLLGGPVA